MEVEQAVPVGLPVLEDLLAVVAELELHGARAEERSVVARALSVGREDPVLETDDEYFPYYKRYHAHAEAQKFAKKQLKETENRMVLLQESSDDAKWSDVEFLKTANEQLVEQWLTIVNTTMRPLLGKAKKMKLNQIQAPNI